jgi:hypothetical protein
MGYVHEPSNSASYLVASGRVGLDKILLLAIEAAIGGAESSINRLGYLNMQYR